MNLKLTKLNSKSVNYIKENQNLYWFVRKVQYFATFFRKSISGNGNNISIKGVLFNTKFDIIGNNNTVIIARGSVINNFKIFIRGNNNVLKIGEFCYISGGEAWFEDDFNEISIGNKTTIEDAHLAITENNHKIIIGEDCMFSNAIEIRTGDSHSVIDNTTNSRINLSKDVFIGNHVWLGSGAKILKGVVIEDNSIVATQSVVTNLVPSNSIVAGIPAKVIRQNINWMRERI